MHAQPSASSLAGRPFRCARNPPPPLNLRLPSINHTKRAKTGLKGPRKPGLLPGRPIDPHTTRRPTPPPGFEPPTQKEAAGTHEKRPCSPGPLVVRTRSAAERRAAACACLAQRGAREPKQHAKVPEGRGQDGHNAPNHARGQAGDTRRAEAAVNASPHRRLPKGSIDAVVAVCYHAALGVDAVHWWSIGWLGPRVAGKNHNRTFPHETQSIDRPQANKKAQKKNGNTGQERAAAASCRLTLRRRLHRRGLRHQAPTRPSTKGVEARRGWLLSPQAPKRPRDRRRPACRSIRGVYPGESIKIDRRCG